MNVLAGRSAMVLVAVRLDGEEVLSIRGSREELGLMITIAFAAFRRLAQPGRFLSLIIDEQGVAA